MCGRGSWHGGRLANRRISFADSEASHRKPSEGWASARFISRGGCGMRVGGFPRGGEQERAWASRRGRRRRDSLALQRKVESGNWRHERATGACATGGGGCVQLLKPTEHRAQQVVINSTCVFPHICQGGRRVIWPTTMLVVRGLMEYQKQKGKFRMKITRFTPDHLIT
jgi:hypothetical protein